MSLETCRAEIGTELALGCTTSQVACETSPEFGPEWSTILNTDPDSGCELYYAVCRKREYSGTMNECCLSETGCPVNGVSCGPDRYMNGNVCVDYAVNTCTTHSGWNSNRSFCQAYYVRTNPQTRRLIFTGVFKDGISPVGVRNIAQSDIYEICKLHPDMCSNDLYDLCRFYTLTDVKANRNTAEICGCYLTNAELYEYSSYGIVRECTPACTNINAVKLQDRPCTSGLCIIDDVSIAISRSKGGTIDVSQVCINCAGTAVCRCQISGVNIDIEDSEFQDINLSQNCSGNTRCIDGFTGEEVSCSDIREDRQELSEERSNYVKVSMIITITVAGLVLFYLFFLYLV